MMYQSPKPVHINLLQEFTGLGIDLGLCSEILIYSFYLDIKRRFYTEDVFLPFFKSLKTIQLTCYDCHTSKSKL